MMTEDTKTEKEMPFLDHLEELRWRLLKSVISVFLMMVICFFFSDYILELLLFPGKQIDPPVPLQVLKVQTVFIIKLEIALFAGIIFSLPVIFYQLWQFVAPGLVLTERKLLFKYPIRIAMNPIFSTIGWLLPSLVSGQVIVAIVLSVLLLMLLAFAIVKFHR